MEYEQWLGHIYSLGYREMPLQMKNLLVQGWTKDTITTLAETTYTQAEQALEKKGGDTRYASTSWGLFNEDVRTETVERLGRTLYNTATNKIEGFTTEEQLYNHYNFDPVVFAWNMDPKTTAGINPYNVFGNNPILYVDPDGDKFKFVGYSSFIKAPMSNEVAEKMWEEMKEYLHERGMGKYIDRLENSDHVYEIHFVDGVGEEGKNLFEGAYDGKTCSPDVTRNSVFYLNPFKEGLTTNNYFISPIELIMHELGHGYGFDMNAEIFLLEGGKPDFQYDRLDERWITTTIEQEAARKLGTKDEYDLRPTRTDHNMQKVFTVNRWKSSWDIRDQLKAKSSKNGANTPGNVSSPYNAEKLQPEHTDKNSKIKVTYE